MPEKPSNDVRDGQEQMSRQAEFLADELRLLAINLAVAVAKVQHRERSFRDLEADFAELIRKSNEIAGKVTDVVRAFQSQKNMTWSAPASSEIIDRRGAYDKTEAALHYLLALSQRVQQAIVALQSRQPAPPDGPLSRQSNG